MATKIMTCDCKHTFQDKTYGPGQRVYNETISKGINKTYRCTVCGKEK
jgi:ribosomal protein L37AE/L43A